MSGTKNWVVQWNKNQWNKNWLGPLDFEWWGPSSLSTKRSEQNKNWVLATECPKVPTNFCSADFYSAGLRNFYSALTFLHLVFGVPASQCLKIPTNFYSADFRSTQFLLNFINLFYILFY